MNRNGTQICTFFATLLYHAKSLLSILSETITAYPPNGCLLLTGNDKICYNTYVAAPYAYGGKVVKLMFDLIISFLVTVGAEVAANFLYDYIRNRLNGRKK